MIYVKAEASFGFVRATHEEEFEFPDDYTDEEIESEIWDWAQQFVEIDWRKE